MAVTKDNAGTGAPEKKAFDPLEGTQAGEVVKAAPKLSKEEFEKKSRRLATEDTIRKEKKTEKGFFEKAGENIGIGKGGIYAASGQMDSRVLADKAKEDLANRDAKFKEELDKHKITMNAYIDDRLSRMTPEEGNAWLAGQVSTIQRSGTTIDLTNAKEQLRLQKDVLNEIMTTLKSQYFLGNGQFDYGQMALRAKDMVGAKPETRRSGLDQLQADGPQQFDMPELPDDAQAYLAEVATGMIGSIIQNSIAISAGGTTALAKGTTTDAAQEVNSRVAAMMTMDVNQYREKVEKISLMNQQLQMKYKDDVMRAMVDFDNRAAADERVYNQSLFQAKGMELANAWKVLGREDMARQAVNSIGTFIDAQRNAWEQHEDSQNMMVKRFNADAKNRAANIAAQHASQLQQMEARKQNLLLKNKLVPYKPIFDNAPLMMVSGIDNTSSSLDHVLAMNDVIAKTPNNRRNYNSGMGTGMDTYRKIQSMDLTQEEKATAANNILMMGENEKTLLNSTDETIRQLSKKRIKRSPAGRDFEEGSELQKFFVNRGETQRAYSTGAMHGLLNAIANEMEAKRIQYKEATSESAVVNDLTSFGGDE